MDATDAVGLDVLDALMLVLAFVVMAGVMKILIDLFYKY